MAAEYQLSDNDYELITAYIDGVLTDTEQATFEARLLAEANLRTELEAIRRTVAAVQAMPTLKAPRNFTLTPEMVAETPTESKIHVLPPRRNNITWIFTAAAVIIVAVGLGFLLTQQNADSALTSQSQEVASAPTTIAPEMAEAEGESDSDADMLAPSGNANDEGIQPTPLPDTELAPPDAAESGEGGLGFSAAEASPADTPSSSVAGGDTAADTDLADDAVTEAEEEPQAVAPAVAQDEAGSAEEPDEANEADTGSSAAEEESLGEEMPEEQAQPEAMLQMQPAAESTEEVPVDGVARATTVIPEDRSADADEGADAELSIMADEADGEKDESRTIGEKDFVLQDDVWVDEDYDPEAMELRSVEIDTSRFNRLMNRYEALEEIITELEEGNIIIVLDDIAYEIVRE